MRPRPRPRHDLARRRAALGLSALLTAASAVTASLASLPPEAARPAAAAAAEADAEAAARPNIIFITTDDMRVRDLQAMPATRRLLGDQGTTFVNAYAPFPLCCPARAAWVTGQYNHNNGVMGNSSPQYPEGGYAALDPSSTVSTWLDAAGYQTAFVGKYLNNYGMVKPVSVPPGWDEWHAAVGTNTYYSTALRENHTGALTTTRYDGTYQVDLYDAIARRIIDERVPRADPLFLWVSQYAPHTGGPAEPDDPGVNSPAVPTRYQDLYAGTPLPKDPSYSESAVSDKPAFVSSRGPISPTMEAHLTELNQQRWESLRAVDDSVANIVAALSAQGELENSIVVFTSDNGYMLGEHRLHAGKTVAYEASARVPLLVRGPGFPAGATRRPAVAHIDVAPTFADAAGTSPGLEVDGRSLLPLAQEPATWEARTLVLEAGPRTIGGPDLYHGIRTPRYKYVQHATGEVELYDLRDDPDEMQSLTADPARDRLSARLAAELRLLEDCAGAGCR